jgi:hypothetical protein
MKMQGRFGLATALLLVIPTFAQAQHATGSFRAAPSVPAVAPISHGAAVRAQTGNRTNGARLARAATPSGAGATSAGLNPGTSSSGFLGFGSDPVSVQQLLNPFPEFGFDFTHLAAIHRDDDIKAFIDPATQVRLAERRSRRQPGAGSGFNFLDGGGAYVLPVDAGGVNPDADPQAAQDQGQSGQGALQDRGEQASQQPAAEQGSAESNDFRVAQQEPEPLRDEGEFTLILRSGQEIEAVAFTRVNDKIIYITIGGGRRTLAVRELDVDATVRLNQERGTPLQIPL